ncbi:MAG: hypothetical protein LBR08_00770 [Bacteroidales bacterium]|jgi:hypothetical protein|nr:hypothetical protein [Bacteroidales bacterium]
MGRKVSCNRKTDRLTLRNLSPCQREFIEEKAAVETVRRGYVVSISSVISKIIRERMKSEQFSCGL